jgi:opacity protein-like surface antigen
MSGRLRQQFGGRAAARCAVVMALASVAAFPAAASAQQKPPAAARPAPAPRGQTGIRGFGDIGLTRFAAADTFDATLGSSSGAFLGGGVEVVLPQSFFVNVRLSRFQKTGERVFVDGDEVFPLGIEMKVGITPVEVTGGYRFQSRVRPRNVIPFVGAGIGWHKYSEESDFAQVGDDIEETFTGYHALGGVEFRMSRWFGIAGEAQWTTISDALGSDVSGASEAFGESNLGGLGFRVRFVIGR